MLAEQWNCRDHRMGWMKWAFVLSIYFLRRASVYAEKGLPVYGTIIRKVIQLGGDTDTNACIVGGVIGCLVGKEQIPS